jgi:hypothetical protein
MPSAPRRRADPRRGGRRLRLPRGPPLVGALEPALPGAEPLALRGRQRWARHSRDSSSREDRSLNPARSRDADRSPLVLGPPGGPKGVRYSHSDLRKCCPRRVGMCGQPRAGLLCPLGPVGRINHVLDKRVKFMPLPLVRNRRAPTPVTGVVLISLIDRTTVRGLPSRRANAKSAISAVHYAEATPLGVKDSSNDVACQIAAPAARPFQAAPHEPSGGVLVRHAK